jgi:uncharacterized protein (TIGR02594 family)
MVTTPIEAPLWIVLAQSKIGLKEIKGKTNNPYIVQMWTKIKAPWFKDDETPWCAAFVGSILEAAGVQSTRNARALSYETWGTQLKKPAFGCIATVEREGGGHVFFIVGITPSGRLVGIGGNQNDSVCLAAFNPKVIKPSAYRYPNGYTPSTKPLPVYNIDLTPVKQS